MVKVTFGDVVRKIGKTSEDKKYSVIFQLHSAFYTLDPKDAASLEALTFSARDGSEVVVTHDGETNEIIEAQLP